MRRLGGSVVSFDVTCGDVSQTLKALTGHGINLYNIVHKNELSVIFSVSSNDITSVKQILNRRGDGFRQIVASPGWIFLNIIKKRWLILLAISFIFDFSIWIPSRILFVEILGNSKVHSALIEEKIGEMGIKFGAKRSNIRSESLKNAMLSEIPELDWVGVTTAGCVATVEVREKAFLDKDSLDSEYIASVVADTDGVIEEITVTKGIALCKKGQVVKKGQVLISGYEDCGLLIKAARAQGEVIGQTSRQIKAVSPSNVSVRGKEKYVKTNYSLLIGKKFINFKNNSGISPTSCVKIYEEKYMTLPGGYQLPVALVSETLIYYETENCVLDEKHFAWMEQGIDLYTANIMSAGTILNKRYSTSCQDNFFQCTGLYICREQIGKYRIEEKLIHDRKNS